MSGRHLPDLRSVYYDWGPEKLRVGRFSSEPICCSAHRWTTISPEVVRAVRRAGLPTRPNWYAGPTTDAYCERCGVFRDQAKARALRWRVMKAMGDVSLRHSPSCLSEEGPEG